MIYSSLNFSLNSLKFLNQLRKKKQTCDINIKLNGVSYPAHKAILIAGSPFLHQHLSVESGSSFTIGLKLTNTKVMEEILTFLYTGDIDLSQDKLAETMLLGAYLQISEIQTLTTKFLQSVQTVGVKSSAPIEVTVHHFVDSNEEYDEENDFDDEPNLDESEEPIKEVTQELVPFVAEALQDTEDRFKDVKFDEDLKKHVCKICNRPFNNRNNCMRHTLLHTGVRPFMCDLCGKSYKRKETLNKHCSSGSCRKGISPTKQRRRDRQQRRIFRKKVKGNSNNYSITDPQILEYLDTNSAPDIFLCTKCGKENSSLGNFRRHIRIHTGEKPFQCTTCLKHFPRKDSLQAHTSRWKNGACYVAPDKQLPEGASITRTVSLINSHIKSAGTTRAILETNSQETLPSDGLIQELENAQNFCPFVCAECDLRFEHFQDFSNHRSVEHDVTEEIKCPICHLEFGKELWLTKHLFYHNKERQNTTELSTIKRKVFVCILCAESFQDEESFQAHGSKICITYCRFCNKVFASRAHLDRHVRTHINEDFFACSVCKDSFKTRKKLAAHLKQEHSIIMPKYARFGSIPQIVEVDEIVSNNTQDETNIPMETEVEVMGSADEGNDSITN
uniref:Myoneurin n=1 Tax=Phallusia mammillata TaxID=59560 RepID=A0A6F9DL19_9ASCI|nr:myoneurin [Phallusia mammillata]